MVTVYKAPQDTNEVSESGLKQVKFFLAGSINMGNATNWQDQLTDVLTKISEKLNAEFIIYNPRRDDWDASWEQTLENKEFVEQVTWELDHMEKADVVLMYFDAEGESPITLLELGLNAQKQKLVVCCPDEFWRSGNVYVTCQKYGIPFVKTFEELEAKLNKIQ